MEIEIPDAFISRTQALLGSEWPAFESALKEESPVSIRLNPYKSSTEILNSFGKVEIVPWASQAYYLPYRPSFTFDPLFHAGCYYVQEASSMFLEQIIRKEISKPVKVLDLCAAPGGKSTQLVSVLPEGSLLVANEIIRSRAHILTENLIKWGNPNIVITNNDPSAIGKSGACFDVIVADVPCSGEGMFRKDVEVINEWSPHAIRLCAERQKRIIAGVWPALKQDGLLIYSTCTYNKEENEDVILWICKELKAEIAILPHRFMPHQIKGEGFFIAAIRKKEGKRRRDEKDRKQEKRKRISIPPEIKNRFIDEDYFSVFADNNLLTIVPSLHSEDYLFLKNRLKIISAGTTLGETKGKDFVPAHALAMSVFLASSAFPKWELDKETALRYLRKEALQTTAGNLPKGYVLVTYLNSPLGFIKNIGIRANNLYPQEWRIRASAQSK
jgi:16S rRNA C967 or C1407 C5-methylase (RsmB/RsmF family)/NOL1/NOP2/fmu family ribosome biogenesis protein